MMEGIGVGLVAKDEVTSGAGPAEGEGYSEELSSPDVKISQQESKTKPAAKKKAGDKKEGTSKKLVKKKGPSKKEKEDADTVYFLEDMADIQH